MHQKVDLRKRSRKGRQNGECVKMKWLRFGSHFPSKIDEKIDAKIETEKVRKIEEKVMRKQTYILMIFGIAFHEKSSFSKKVHVRKPHDSCSRIGVREGPPKNKETEKRGNSVKKPSKNRSRKRDDN